MRLSLYVVATVAASQAYGGHIALFNRLDCEPSFENAGDSVLEIAAETDIGCAPIDGAFSSAVSYYNTGLPCEFRLYNSRTCSSSSLIHTIRTENPTGQCFRARGLPQRYLAVTTLCGSSFPKRGLEEHPASNETEVEVSSVSKRALNWSELSNFLGQRFARLRRNRPVYNDYAQTHHILIGGTISLATAVLTQDAAARIAIDLVNNHWTDRGWGAHPTIHVGTHTIGVSLRGLRVTQAGGVRRRVTIAQLVQGLGESRLEQLMMANFRSMRLNNRSTITTRYYFIYGEQESFEIEIYVE